MVVDNLVADRRDLANKTSNFAASCLHLGMRLFVCLFVCLFACSFFCLFLCFFVASLYGTSLIDENYF